MGAHQGSLFHGSLDDLLNEPCLWHEGLPNLEGLAKFTHLMQSPFDARRMDRKEIRASGGGSKAWRTDLSGDPREWAARIVRLLRDRGSMTFNGIVLELTGRRYNAVDAGAKAPEKGLWLAVERGLLVWANITGDVVRFAVIRPRDCAIRKEARCAT